jgi:hypothetical protein
MTPRLVLTTPCPNVYFAIKNMIYYRELRK